MSTKTDREWESSLRPADRVMAKWSKTVFGTVYTHRSVATVKRVNKLDIEVWVEHGDDDDKQVAGGMRTIPRTMNQQRNADNRIEPLPIINIHDLDENSDESSIRIALSVMSHEQRQIVNWFASVPSAKEIEPREVRETIALLVPEMTALEFIDSMTLGGLLVMLEPSKKEKILG